MKKLWAVLTPQVLLVLVLLLIGVCVLFDGRKNEETALEERISRALSSVNGIGEVRVVISTRTVQAQASLGLSKSQNQEIPCGAVAVVQGADDPIQCAQIMDALCRLLGLPASAVSVISGGE